MKSMLERKLCLALGLIKEAFGFPKPAKGRTLGDLKGRKQPHVNPLTNELWSPSDPNWEEGRATGAAWTAEELVLALVPYVAQLANRASRMYSVDVDDLMQRGFQAILEKGLGKVKETDPTKPGREVGDWYDKGLMPFDQLMYRRLKSTFIDYGSTGKGKGAMKHGRALADKPVQVSTATPVGGEEGSMELGDILAAKVADLSSIASNKDLFSRYAAEAGLSEPETIYMQVAYSLGERPSEVEAWKSLREPEEHQPGEQPGRPPEAGELRKTVAQKKGKFGKQGPAMMGPTAERGPKEAAIAINRDPRLYQRFVEIGVDTDSALGNIKLIRTVPLDARKLSSAGINMQTDADLIELPHIEKVNVQGVPAINIVTKKVTNSIRNSAAVKITNKAAEFEATEPDMAEAIRRITNHLSACLVEDLLNRNPIIESL